MLPPTNSHLLRLLALAVLSISLLTAGDRPAASPAPPLVPEPEFGQLPVARVLRVARADTVVVRLDGEGQRIVLLGVEPPPAGSPGGQAARQFVENLLLGETVYVAVPAGNRGRRGNELAACIYRQPDGLFVNLELVRQGYARVPADDVFEQRAAFEAYEARARAAEKGIWSPARAAREPPAGSTVARTDAGGGGAVDPGRGGAVQTRPSDAPAADHPADVVYVTAKGKKYHRQGCYHLRGKGQPLPLNEAKARGLTPCAHCKPPQ